MEGSMVSGGAPIAPMNQKPLTIKNKYPTTIKVDKEKIKGALNGRSKAYI